MFVVAGCGPSFNIDLNLDAGPVVGDKGFATFSFVDGCPGSDPLVGCPQQLPSFAIGSRARFVIGSVTGDADDQHRLALAELQSSNPAVVIAGRDAAGLVVLSSIAAGEAALELKADGAVIDSITVHVEPIASMATHAGPPAVVLKGVRFAVGVDAHGPKGELLFAHAAIVAKTFGGLVLDTDTSGFFTGSEQVVVRSDIAGEVRVEFMAGNVSTQTDIHVVSRDEITSIDVTEPFGSASNTNKAHVVADARVGDVLVSGGPGCDWSIVSGGGPGAALAAGVDDNANGNNLFHLYNSAVVFGSGDTVVECQASDTVVGRHTIHFAP